MAKQKAAPKKTTALVTYEVLANRLNTQGRITGNQYYLAKGEKVKAPEGEFAHVPTLVK